MSERYAAIIEKARKSAKDLREQIFVAVEEDNFDKASKLVERLIMLNNIGTLATQCIAQAEREKAEAEKAKAPKLKLFGKGLTKEEKDEIRREVNGQVFGPPPTAAPKVESSASAMPATEKQQPEN